MSTIFAANYERYRLNAKLALAEQPIEYAALYHQFYGKPPALFEVGGSTYHSFLNKDNEPQVELLGAFTFHVLSILKDESAPDKPKFDYNLAITPKGKKALEVVASGAELAAPRDIKRFFLSHTGCHFKGKTNSVEAFNSAITQARAPCVTQLQCTGYDLKTRWYVFPTYAVDTQGTTHLPDKTGIFKVSSHTYLRPAKEDTDKFIVPDDAGPSVKEIHNLISAAWGNTGLVALSWAISSWFVNQIKASQLGYFPILSIYGPPSSGKSALSTILNALQSNDDEGTPITAFHTKNYTVRSIAIKSGLFSALTEDNNREKGNFDYSIILTGYNKGTLRGSAAYSGDNRTIRKLLLSALAFVQNVEPFISQAERERVISLLFDVRSFTDSTSAAFARLRQIPISQLARFIILVLEKRKIFEDDFYSAYQRALGDLEQIKHRRIAGNHALILAFHRLLCQVFKIDGQDLTETMIELAKEKMISSAEQKYSLADIWFEAIDSINPDKRPGCMWIDTENDRMLVNLPAITEQLRNSGTTIPANDVLIAALSSHKAFLRNKALVRFPEDPNKAADNRPRPKRAWEFKLSKI